MKYFKIFAMQCKLATMSVAIYRANFIIGIIGRIFGSVTGIICIGFIYGSVESIAGWNKQEMIILVCTANIVVSGIYNLFIRHTQDKLVEGISNGNFDRIILKPLNLMFQLNIGRPVNIMSNFISFCVQVGIICVQINQLGVQIGLIQILLYILFIVNGVIILSAFQLLLYSLAFVFIKVGELNNIYYTLADIVPKPRELFSNKYVANIFIFVLPAIPIANAPAAVLLQKCTVFDMICWLGATVIISLLAVTAIKSGMRRYNSASS